MSERTLSALRGAGGGGGKSGGGSGRAPIEAPDSLRSKQYARVLDLVSEGEIFGLENGLKSVYLDDTPIQNEDDSYNFNGVTLITRNGTQDQDHIPGFDSVENEQAVGVEVKQAMPVVRSITDETITAVRVTIGIPQLTTQNTSTGDLTGATVEYAIDVQSAGGGFIPQPLRSIFSENGVAITSSGASSTAPSSNFNLTVSWVGESLPTPQTCGISIQYRAVGDVSWSAYESFTFSSSKLTFTGVNSMPNESNGTISQNSSYTSIGTKTFTLNLPEDNYQFRIVKTSGSRQRSSGGPLTGLAYGGSASITGGNAYVPVYTDVISGKTTSRYQRSKRIALTGNAPWDIRIRRITADSSQTILQNKTFWDSYTEIVDAKLRYPNSALAALAIDASQFSSVPTRAYRIKGLKVKIPSNYDPLLRTYTGSWDGTFVTAWTDNPAWCFYDLLINERYGLGEYLSADQVDKWALYSIGKYCDEMIDDGYGGLEPRFTCNLYLQSRAEAYSVLANFSSIFRAITYWGAGTITPVQDAPADPVALFTAANVIDGSFNYQGSSAQQRHTVVLVSWNDPADNYRTKVEYVEDVDGIERYGVIQSEVVAFGCSSRGQAHRFGRAIIYSEQMESETITFRCGLDGTTCYPGAIIQVQDQFRAGARMGGRLLSATTTAVTLDAAVTLESGKEYTLSCVLPDGSIEDRVITTAAGVVDTLSLATPFSQAPQVMAMWIITTQTLQPTSWRVVSITQVEKAQLEITALAYRSDKYLAIEQGLVLQPISYSNLRANPLPVSNLNVTETLTLVGLGVIGIKATVSWDTNQTGLNYILRYQLSEQNFVELSATSNNTVEISPIQEGKYLISVVAINSIGRRSPAAEVSVIIYGKTLPPVSVPNFSVTKVGGVALAAWSLHPDLDVQVGGQIVVRHSQLLDNTFWEEGIILDAFPGSSINGLLPLITGTYLAKAVDSSGNWSDTTTSFVVTEGMLNGFTTAATTIQSPAFSGNKLNIVQTGGVIQLAAVTLIDDMTDPIDDWGFIDFIGGIVSSGQYDFESVMDLSSVATRRFEADIKGLSFDTGEYIDAKLELIDTWGPIDGDAINDCDATLYVSTTNDDPAGSPVWTEWAPFFVADLTCRAARFKLELESASPTHNISISALRVDAKVLA